MSKETDLIKALDDCPVGNAGWKQFEDICTEILHTPGMRRGPCWQ